MFDNIAGITAAVDIANPRLKIAIVSAPGLGKSWLAATAPKPVFDMDFDTRVASLQGKSGVYVKTYADADPSMPHVVNDLDADIGAFEYARTKGEDIPATFVLDSMTYLRKYSANAFMKQQPTMARSIKMGSKVFQIPNNWDIVNATRDYMEYIVSRLSALGNVIACFHEQDETDKSKSTKDQKVYTGRMTIQPQFMNSILSIFDDVWRIEVDYSGKRMVKTGITNDFAGKTSLLIDSEEVPDIEAMLEKHRTRIQVKEK